MDYYNYFSLKDRSNKTLIDSLKKLGKLEKNIPSNLFIDLLNHPNSKVRELSVYNLGKIDFDTSLVKKFYLKENDSLVKREYISSIGRKKNKKNIDFLINVLNEKDPKIILQAIRSLLYFKDNKNVIDSLNELRSHPNEMIQSVLESTFSKKKYNRKDHSKVDSKLSNVVVNGDVLKVLKLFKEEKFHLTFTSPPYYNARDYSIYNSYQEYLNFLKKVFLEVHRLTKNGRFLVVNTSPVIEPRVSRNHSSKRYPIPFDLNTILVNQGWEFIDDIIWRKPEPSVKNRIGGFMQHRKPLGYKPNSVTEYLMVYRKKTTDLIDWNIKQYEKDLVNESKVDGFFETSNLWEIDPTFDKKHSAVFPKQLCENVIKYYSMLGDLVFDPFAGSGTFGYVASQLNRNFFLTEINEDYYNRIKEKISSNNNLFDKNTNAKYFNLNEFKKHLK